MATNKANMRRQSAKQLQIDTKPVLTIAFKFIQRTTGSITHQIPSCTRRQVRQLPASHARLQQPSGTDSGTRSQAWRLKPGQTRKNIEGHVQTDGTPATGCP
jgi:hypothetical protein